MSDTTVTTLFSGGGFVDCGAMAAGLTPIRAVEYDADIAGCYRQNLGDHVLVMPAQCVNWHKEERPLFGHASPVCKSFSVANSGAVESPEDIQAAEGVCNFIRILQPKVFTLENVRKYQRSQSLANIRRALAETGYQWSEEVVNSANYGVPQTRERLILRAVWKGSVPPLRPTHAQKPMSAGLFEDVPVTPRWRGWYEAIEDLIPTLPPSKFAAWQLKRLPADLTDFLMAVQGESSDFRAQVPPAPGIAANHGASKYRAFIVEGSAAGEDNKFNMPVRSADEPVFTMRGQQNNPRAFLVSDQGSGSGETEGVGVRNADAPCLTIDTRQATKTRAWLEQGRVVSMTPRALARFQTIPDWYALPAKASLACQIIGNAVPSLLYEVIAKGLLEAL